jgi:hypothetical protein
MKLRSRRAALVISVPLFVIIVGILAVTTAPHSTTTMQTTTISGTLYGVVDVSWDTTVGAPGYTYFHNGSINFDGVTFKTICSSSYYGCPGSENNSTAITPLAGAIIFNMTFPDGSTERASAVIGDLNHVLVMSQHTNPKAGILIQYVNDNSPSYYVYLLVSK